MSNQEQIGVGMLVVIAITLIVGAIFLQAIAQEVGKSTDIVTITDLSLGNQTNGTTYYLNDYRALSSVVIRNSTTILSSGNYTVTNNVINPTTGGLAVSILPASAFTGQIWTLNATAQPVTYIADSGARAVSTLIIIMFALAIAVVALTPVLKNGFLEMIGK